MHALMWSMLERLLPRALSAALMLALAALLSPQAVGAYAWMILAVTLVQTVGDVAARQTAILHYGSTAATRFIRQIRAWSAAGGGLLILATVGALLLTQRAEEHFQILGLLPFALVPACSASGLDAILRLQLAGRWRTIASAQTIASLTSMLISIPTLLLTHSLLASALQATIAEGVFAGMNRASARKLGQHDARTVAAEPPNLMRAFLHTATFALLGWGQGQTDRLAIGALAGTARLGQYSFAMALSRSIGDAVAIAAVNTLRPTIAAAAAGERRGLVESSLRRALPLSAVAAVLAILATELLVRPALAPSWNAALDIVPVLSLAVLPSVVAWSITTILQAEGRMRWASPVKAAGVVLSIPIGFVAVADLQLAAWLVNARELLIMGLLLLVARADAPWRGALLACALLTAGGLLWWLI